MRSLQSFHKVSCSLVCVRVVADFANTVSVWSLTKPTPCPCSQQLCPHHFSVVNNYFCTCPHCQRQCWHRVTIVNDDTDMQFLKISNYIFQNFFVFFFFNLSLGPDEIESWIKNKLNAENLVTLSIYNSIKIWVTFPRGCILHNAHCAYYSIWYTVW